MEDLELTSPQKQESKFAIGIKYGLIASVVYVLLILIRYLFLADNPMIFTGAMFFSYVIILVFFVVAAMEKKKSLGGYADFKDLFTTIFIVILFAELSYTIFNYIYLNFIDPDFFTGFMQSTKDYVNKMGGSVEALNEQMAKMKAQNAQKMSISNSLNGLGIWILVDSIIGFLIALIIRKPRPTPF